MIRNGQKSKSAQLLEAQARHTSVIITGKPKAGKWFSPVVAWATARLPGLSLGPATAALVFRPGASAGALRQENNHFKGDRGIFSPGGFPAKEPNICMPGKQRPL